MEWVIWRTRRSMVSWTEERERSVTSRQAVERLRSERVRDLEEEEAAAEVDLARSVRSSRMASSGLRRFLNGAVLSGSPSSARRRFFLSAIARKWREVSKIFVLGGLG
ncbi:hypothetical protein L1049_009359 [Liquidambar formosana]|uniref:Uncharacterized protein n=1 Tax=Liquidambar formosana TaxID=63359 RepID=A0AAP0S4S7_LIQFO